MQEQMERIYQLIKLSEKLKMELRHSWLSNGRQESVAEHTWRLSLMAIVLQPYLEKDIHMEKLLKMLIIHDLVEAEAKDIPAFETLHNEALRLQKQQNERKAIENIRSMLQDKAGEEIYQLWLEFETKETYEAKVANALDKLEVQIQHLEADIRTWKDIEYEMCFMLEKHTSFSPILSELKSLIEQEAREKISQAKGQYLT
ncbi:HD domain-containing protein [Virgibacillus proomii]|jgi:putative hydrolases of HD superfamily|uniref:HD domain-containing protein n=1 Tax=Virgibacillus proomii TaxID=84407 RepID=UPI003A28285C